MFALKSNPNSLEAFLNISLFLLTEHTKAFLGAEEGLILLLLDTFVMTHSLLALEMNGISKCLSTAGV